MTETPTTGSTPNSQPSPSPAADGPRSPLRPALGAIVCSVILVAAMAASWLTDDPYFPPGVWLILLTWLPLTAVGCAIAAWRRVRVRAVHWSLPVRITTWLAIALGAAYGLFAIAFFVGEIIGHD